MRPRAYAAAAETRAAEGFIAGRDRSDRWRREMGLRCKQKRRFKAIIHSNHNRPVAKNQLDQPFSPTAPNPTWVADLTEIATGEGWLYLAGI